MQFANSKYFLIHGFLKMEILTLVRSFDHNFINTIPIDLSLDFKHICTNFLEIWVDRSFLNASQLFQNLSLKLRQIVC